MAEQREPFMCITKVGCWTYELAYVAGGVWMPMQGPRVLGLARAKRRASRDLKRLNRLHGPRSIVAEVR